MPTSTSRDTDKALLRRKLYHMEQLLKLFKTEDHPWTQILEIEIVITKEDLEDE